MSTPAPRHRESEAIHPALRRFPSKLFVEVTSRCNLSCCMCVKQQRGNVSCDGDLSRESFARLEPAFPHLETLILNGIGEPLLHPDLEQFIRTAKQLMPERGQISFQTNGQLITNLKALSLIEAGLDRICISIDGSSPETFRRFREGGDILDIEYAFAALSAAKERCNRPDVEVGIEFVAMRSNLGELPATLRWAADHGASFALLTHMLPYDSEQANEAAYGTCTAEAQALFNRCKTEAARQGLDVKRYFDARWKYRRTQNEHKLVGLVNAMKGEAARLGIFLDMKKLLMTDSRADEVAAVFDQAREVARDTGLDLRLPEVALTQTRHCNFVEDGGAFISWEGDVSPCYFLWHSFSCHASEWEQRVRHKVFGNLSEHDMVEIWNDPEFRAFREQVMEYEYSECASCTLAPCDYVQTDKFEHDCHIRNVPCGACLWCMGVFQCLQ